MSTEKLEKRIQIIRTLQGHVKMRNDFIADNGGLDALRGILDKYPEYSNIATPAIEERVIADIDMAIKLTMDQYLIIKDV